MTIGVNQYLLKLRDIYEDKDKFPEKMECIGPEFDYMIKAAAKGLDNREGDSIDSETITNAASVQIQLKFGSKKVLLTGDCTPAAIPESVKLNTYDYIQLPHHGKPVHAEEIFKRVGNNNSLTYIVSDNTGTTNGGSDKLNTKGHRVKNTKNGDIILSSTSNFSSSTGRTLGI